MVHNRLEAYAKEVFALADKMIQDTQLDSNYKGMPKLSHNERVYMHEARDYMLRAHAMLYTAARLQSDSEKTL